MALNEQLGDQGVPKTPREQPPTPKPETPKPPSFIRGEDLRRGMKDESGALQAKTGMYSEERIERTKKLFGSLEYGLTAEKAEKKLRQLQQKLAYETKDDAKRELNKDIKTAQAVRDKFKGK